MTGERTVVLVDIDGTCAHRSDRSPYDESRVGEDEPDHAVRAVVAALAGAGHDIVYLSGRSERCRAATEQWLVWCGFPPGPVHMRSVGDQRPDTEVKAELFDRHVVAAEVLAVIDDRPSVCRMWRGRGLTVFQVGDPHVEF